MLFQQHDAPRVYPPRFRAVHSILIKERIMADLIIECYASTADEGNFQLQDKFLGKVSITTLSSTSQSAAIPIGTKYVKLSSDATATVFFAFGKGSITATTASQGLYCAEDEKILFTGINAKDNNVIAARTA